MSQPKLPGTYEANTWCGRLACWENDEAFVASLRKNRSFEQELIRGPLLPYIQRARTMVDIGAHVGMHTVAYAHLVPEAKIYSFEPQKKMFELLQRNVAVNGFTDRVVLMNLALGHQSGMAELAKAVQDGSHANTPIEYGTRKRFNLGGLSLGRGGETVHMTRLDDMHLPECDYIKIDVEGFEPLVLQGAQQTIDRCMPVVLFEMNHKKITNDMRSYFGFEGEIETTHGFFERRGYSIRILPDDNYLALPPGLA